MKSSRISRRGAKTVEGMWWMENGVTGPSILWRITCGTRVILANAFIWLKVKLRILCLSPSFQTKFLSWDWRLVSLHQSRIGLHVGPSTKRRSADNRWLLRVARRENCCWGVLQGHITPRCKYDLKGSTLPCILEALTITAVVAGEVNASAIAISPSSWMVESPLSSESIEVVWVCLWKWQWLLVQDRDITLPKGWTNKGVGV